jgi:hypothetical protein
LWFSCPDSVIIVRNCKNGGFHGERGSLMPKQNR